MNRVYLSSLSQATSLGDNLVDFWDMLVSAQSGARSINEIDDIDFSSIPIQFCHTLRSNRLVLPPRNESQVYLENVLLLEQLLGDLQVNGPIDGVIWGNGQVGLPSHLAVPNVDSTSISAREWQSAVQRGIQKATGQTLSPSQIIGLAVTCNTGIAALGMAAQRISQGLWKRAIVVVQEIRCRDRVLLPYYKLNLLSHGRTHPFSKNRDGFEKGEGGCAFLLESTGALNESKGDPYCRISGYSVSSEHEHVFESNPDSIATAAATIKSAIRHAQLETTDIDYINLYGSGSIKNDRMECRLVKATFGDRYRSIPASSLKPYFGHLNHAASAIETTATAMMIKNQCAVSNLGLKSPDGECDLFLPTDKVNTFPIRHALKVSFGFGWSNAALVLSHI